MDEHCVQSIVLSRYLFVRGVLAASLAWQGMELLSLITLDSLIECKLAL